MRTVPLILPFAVAADKPPPSRPGFFRRLLKAMVDTRRRQAEREASFYLEVSGLKFTDATERELERRFLSSGSFHLD